MRLQVIVRLLYLYPEEWTGRLAQEIQVLSTCVALAQSGLEVTLATAGGERFLSHQLQEVTGRSEEPGFQAIALSRKMGPVRSASIFSFHFRLWLRQQPRFEAAYILHPEAASLLDEAQIPFLFEARQIFAETLPEDEKDMAAVHALEKQALSVATWRVATSKALAVALRARCELPNDFSIVPNAGLPPLPHSVASAEGPLVYGGSLAEGNGVETIIEASREANLALKIVGGTADEWRRLGDTMSTAHVTWQPRVALADLPQALAGARAGLIPTRLETPVGRYSCPMKLFDYARCGLPVLSTALPALESLKVGSWCTQVPGSTVKAWTQAMRDFCSRAVQGETARAWAGAHTWSERGHALVRLLYAKRPA